VATGEVFSLSVQARFFKRDFRVIQPDRIAATPYTRYTTGGPSAQGYNSLESAMAAVAVRVRSSKSPTFSQLYFPEVDSAEHGEGVESVAAWAGVLRLDSCVKALRSALGPSARIVVSADHGQMSTPDHSKRTIADGDELQPLLRVWPPAGEPRMVCFHVREGRRQEFVSLFNRRFDGEFVLISTDEAETLRLFGPSILSPKARGRIGDFIAIPEGDHALVYAGEPGIAAMRGMHGGLTPDEMRIPLVVG
jgi:hypothetical protein